MFVHEEIVVRVEYVAAQARLANLVRSGELRGPSAQAYDSVFVHELRVGPIRALSHLVRAEFRDLVVRDGSCLLTFRWEATGPGAVLLPVLDADITITPDSPHAVKLRLDGSYRPPLGSIGVQADRALLNHAARATMRAFLNSISVKLTLAPGHATGHALSAELRPSAETDLD